MRLRTSLVLSVGLLLPASGFCSPIIVFQETFDELTGQAAVTSAGGFTATVGNVDIVGPGYFPNLCNTSPLSDNCADLDGSVQGTISSGSFAFLPGFTYTLSFDLVGSQRGNTTSTLVTLGSIYSHTFTLASRDFTDGIVSLPFSVLAPTNAALIFASQTSGNIGSVLDNILITEVSGVTTPEPATLGLAGLGLCLFGLARRRISRQRR